MGGQTRALTPRPTRTRATRRAILTHRLRAPVGVHVRPMLDALMITFGIASVGIYLPFIIAVGSARKELPKLAPEYSSRLFSGMFEQYNPVWMIFLFSERVPERAR